MQQKKVASLTCYCNFLQAIRCAPSSLQNTSPCLLWLAAEASSLCRAFEDSFLALRQLLSLRPHWPGLQCALLFTATAAEQAANSSSSSSTAQGAGYSVGGMSGKMADAKRLLGVEDERGRSAGRLSRAEVRQAFRHRAVQVHPDSLQRQQRLQQQRRGPQASSCETGGGSCRCNCSSFLCCENCRSTREQEAHAQFVQLQAAYELLLTAVDKE